MQTTAQSLRRDAVLDASVLFQEPIRSLLLWIAADEGFKPAWSELILEEVRRNLLRKNVSDAERWKHLREQMVLTFPEAMVNQADIEDIADQMPNDPKDRHVLAAAVTSEAPLVITNNLKHFKDEDLRPLGKRSLSADDYLCELLDKAPHIVEQALANQAASMKRPREWTVEQLLGGLAGLDRDPLAPRFTQAAARRLGVTVARPPRAGD